ncbi:MAG: sigma-70 family RNA polymerase sigma factor [Acidobacteriia bacterium]|nr:sigma-70 family RNA polymerase sigma factor [Terriglobia bacterium]
MTKPDERIPSLRFDAREEQALVSRLQGRRDQSAFLEVYDRYSRLVYHLARKILQNDQEAEEILQDVFWQFWKSLDRLDLNKGNLSSWLVTMARNRSIDYLRVQRRRRETLDDDVDETGQSLSARTEVESFAEKISVQKALAALTNTQRQALELAYYWGLSHQEISERLGEPLGTIKTRIRSALNELRNILGPPAKISTVQE